MILRGIELNIFTSSLMQPSTSGDRSAHGVDRTTYYCTRCIEGRNPIWIKTS